MIVICVQRELTENEVEAKDSMHLSNVFSNSRDQIHWWIFFSNPHLVLLNQSVKVFTVLDHCVQAYGISLC